MAALAVPRSHAPHLAQLPPPLYAQLLRPVNLRLGVLFVTAAKINLVCRRDVRQRLLYALIIAVDHVQQVEHLALIRFGHCADRVKQQQGFGLFVLSQVNVLNRDGLNARTQEHSHPGVPVNNVARPLVYRDAANVADFVNAARERTLLVTRVKAGVIWVGKQLVNGYNLMPDNAVGEWLFELGRGFVAHSVPFVFSGDRITGPSLADMAESMLANSRRLWSLNRSPSRRSVRKIGRASCRERV